MNCPHCNVHIDEHPASRCLDAWVLCAIEGKEFKPMECRVMWNAEKQEAVDFQPHFGYPVGHVLPLHYSTDIAAALEVWNKLADEGWIVSVCLGKGRDGRKYASIQASIDLFLKADLMARSATQIDAKAMTVPHVMCRFAIKAKHDQ